MWVWLATDIPIFENKSAGILKYVKNMDSMFYSYFVWFPSIVSLSSLHYVSYDFIKVITWRQWLRRKTFPGVQGRGSGLVGGPGAEPPGPPTRPEPDARTPDPEPPGRRNIFENLQKIPEENSKNCCIFPYFAKKLQKHALNFRAFRVNTQLVGEILRKFWKFLMKIQ